MSKKTMITGVIVGMSIAAGAAPAQAIDYSKIGTHGEKHLLTTYTTFDLRNWSYSYQKDYRLFGLKREHTYPTVKFTTGGVEIYSYNFSEGKYFSEGIREKQKKNLKQKEKTGSGPIDLATLGLQDGDEILLTLTFPWSERDNDTRALSRRVIEYCPEANRNVQLQVLSSERLSCKNIDDGWISHPRSYWLTDWT